MNKEEDFVGLRRAPGRSVIRPWAPKPYRVVVAPGLIGGLARNDDQSRPAARVPKDASLLEIGVAALTGDRCRRAGLEMDWLVPWLPLGVAPMHARYRSLLDFAEDRESAPAPRLPTPSLTQYA